MKSATLRLQQTPNSCHTRNSRHARNSYFSLLPAVASVTLALLLLAVPAHHTEALEVAGVSFPDTTEADYYYPAMTLNGAATRKYYYVVDMYVGLLYLQNPSSDANTIFADEGYKRMVFHTLLSRASGRRIGKALYEALKLSPEEAAALGAPIDTVIDMFDVEMHEGDETFIEYIPGEGTRIVIKGNVRGEIASKDLFNAFLGIWIGEEPFSEEFKAGILGTEHRLVAN